MLEGYLTGLAKVQQSAPAKTPQEVDEQLRGLGRLAAEYQMILSPAQIELLGRVEEATGQEAAKQTELALTWLGSCERDLDQLNSDGQGQDNGSKLQKLLGRLDEPPAFLPLEARERLNTCQQGVRLLVDQDKSLQVEMHFKQIADRQKQLECLERLRQLVQEH